MFDVTVITPPAAPVVSTEAAMVQCRVTHFEEHDLLAAYAAAAEARCEDVTGRQLLTATLEMWGDGFSGGAICLPRPNLQSVTSITYLDAVGDEQVMDASDYVVEAFAGPRAAPGRVGLAFGRSWPTTLRQAKAVRIRFVAGYGDASAVPMSIVQGILLTIGTWYQQREDVVLGAVQATPLAASRLWRPFWVR